MTPRHATTAPKVRFAAMVGEEPEAEAFDRNRPPVQSNCDPAAPFTSSGRAKGATREKAIPHDRSSLRATR